MQRLTAGLPQWLLSAQIDHPCGHPRVAGVPGPPRPLSTEIFERYERSEKALVEMDVQGVSIRKVKAIIPRTKTNPNLPPKRPSISHFILLNIDEHNPGSPRSQVPPFAHHCFAFVEAAILRNAAPHLASGDSDQARYSGAS